MRVSDFCAAASSCLGTRWRHQGRLPFQALDCIGLVVVAGRACGVELEPKPPVYGLEPKPEDLLGAIAQVADPVEWPPAAGDVIVLALTNAKAPQHVAIALSGTWMIHTWREAKRVVEGPIDEAWQRRAHSVWRLRGMEAG